MVIYEGSLALAAAEMDWATNWGWAALLFLGIFVFSLYLWSYLSKNLELMKAKDTTYRDADVITFISLTVKLVMIIILVLLGLYVVSQIWTDFNNVIWTPFAPYIGDILVMVTVILVAILIGKELRHISRRARMSRIETQAWHGSAVEVISLLMGYIVYLAAGAIVVLILLSFVQSVQPIDQLSGFIGANGAKIVTTLILLIAIFIVIRLVEAIFEDYKFRTKKFNPKVIDLLKDVVRYMLYIIAFLIAIFMIFSIIGLEIVGIILISMILMFSFLGIVLSYTTARNIVSGLTLMNSYSFDVGDRIRISSDLTGEVLEKNLIFTKIRNEDGEIVDVPNSEIINGRILNFNRSARHGVSVNLEVSSSIPHEKVERIILKVTDELEGLVREPKPEVFARSYIGDKIIYKVKVYVNNSTRLEYTRSDLITHIQDALLSAEGSPLDKVDSSHSSQGMQ
jgi:small-conductance mechanosensitive channel